MYTQMQGRPTYFIAYDSLTATKGRHGPTDTPLPPDARLVAGTHPPVARTPEHGYAPEETQPVVPVVPVAPEVGTENAPENAPENVPASVVRVRRDEEAHAGELLDR
jgi:dolichol-phosphate mannosyltransferase